MFLYFIKKVTLKCTILLKSMAQAHVDDYAQGNKWS